MKFNNLCIIRMISTTIFNKLFVKTGWDDP